jgi:hypothetical protein
VTALLAARRFSWNWGEWAHCSDRVTDVLIREAEPVKDGMEQNVTLHTATLPSAVVRGLNWSVLQVGDDGAVGPIVRVGCTNGRGQFPLHNLAPGRYCLRLEAPVAKAAWIELGSEVLARLVSGPQHADLWAEQLLHSTSSDGLRCVVEPDRKRPGQVVLHVTLNDKDWRAAVAYYKLWSRAGQLMERGFIGLSSAEKKAKTCAGTIALPVPTDEPGEDCYLEVGLQYWAIPFSSRNRIDLKRSLERTSSPLGRRILARRLKVMDAAVQMVMDRMEASQELVRRVWRYAPQSENCIRALLVYLTSGHALGFHRAIYFDWNAESQELVYRFGVGQTERSEFAAVGAQTEQMDFAEQLRLALDRPDWARNDGLHQQMSQPIFSVAGQEIQQSAWWQSSQAELVRSDIGAPESWIGRLRQRINAKAFLICPVRICGELKGMVVVDRRWDCPDSLSGRDLVRLESFVRHAERLMEESNNNHYALPRKQDFSRHVVSAVATLREDLRVLANEIGVSRISRETIEKMSETLDQLDHLVPQSDDVRRRNFGKGSTVPQLGQALLNLFRDSVAGEVRLGTRSAL